MLSLRHKRLNVMASFGLATYCDNINERKNGPTNNNILNKETFLKGTRNSATTEI